MILLLGPDLGPGDAGGVRLARGGHQVGPQDRRAALQGQGVVQGEHDEARPGMGF